MDLSTAQAELHLRWSSVGYLLLMLLLAVILGGLGIATLTHRREAWAFLQRVPGWRRLPDDPQDSRLAYVCVIWLWAGWLAVFGTLLACASLIAIAAGAT
jgi:hypothetical protein